jgi:PAS domain S-box-containing protein
MQTRSTSSFRKRAYELWYKLVTPIKPPADEDQQRRARLLGTIVLAGIVMIGGVTYSPWLDASMRLPLIFSLLTLVAILLLNRAGRFVAGAVLLITMLSATTYLGILLPVISENSVSFRSTLIWIAIPIAITYLLLPVSHLLVVIVCNLAFALIIPTFLPEISNREYIFTIFFIAIASVLALISGLLHQHDQRELAKHAAQLQEERERYRDLFNAGFETLVVHKGGIILDVNPATEEMFGFTREEMIGRHILDIFVPESRSSVSEHYETGSTEMYEAQCWRRDGSIIWVEIRGKPHQYRGQTVRVATVRDITQRREIEAQKLELTIEREKVRILQRFIGDMSHDLRTPLSVMKTATYLIQRLIDQPEKLKLQVESLEKQINHLQDLFDDLLSMSRLDRADTSEYQFRWISPENLVRDLVEAQSKLALRKNITLTFQAEQPVAAVLLDETEFRRMVKHLIMNGLNYTPENGTVQVRLYQREAWVYLEVNDTGPGIPSLDLPLIFERFYRADKARGKETGGTGIGLSIAKKIVEAHNGHIEAESELGKGSTFRVRLPAQMTSISEIASAGS